MSAFLKLAPYKERFRLTGFLLGLTCLVEVNIAGRLMGTDLVCVLGAFYTLLVRRAAPKLRFIQILLYLALLWFAGAVATDLIRDIPLDDMARGQSRIVVLIAALYFLGDRAERDTSWVSSFWLGIMIGFGVKPLISDQYGFSDAPWKFGLGLCFIGIVLIIIERFKSDRLLRSSVALVSISTLALVSLFANYRSLFGILLVASLVLLLRKPLAAFVFARKTNYIALLLLVGCSFAAGQGVLWGYGKLAEAGVLGEAAQTKFESQAKLGLNAIQSGRQESLVSFQAIEDSPIIGHGSWATDPKYTSMLIAMLQSLGATIPPSMREKSLIPSHSYLFGAWVDHGISAVPFWLCVLLLMLLGLKRAVQPNCPHREMVCIISLVNLWDVLFSPFGAQQRVLVAAACVILAAVLKHPVTMKRFNQTSKTDESIVRVGNA